MKVKESAVRARDELGADIEISLVTDLEEIMAYGVAPA
jgi:hypothetical protein